MQHDQVGALWLLLHSATTEVSRHHYSPIKVLRKSLWLFSEELLFPLFLSFFQMWMNVCVQESVLTATASMLTAPTSAPVTLVTKSPQTSSLVKVCEKLYGAIECNSSLHKRLLMKLSLQQRNVCTLLFSRRQWVCEGYSMPGGHMHQHCWFLHLPELWTWVWTIHWWAEMWR